ncbi:MAG: hypothetical protein F9K23_12345 [Bacteroidetes bacterium]|jgi:hypothetical protein|nr:MAG: hypothetical protein F9K23_12345 [Bacteroidota bacterium]
MQRYLLKAKAEAEKIQHIQRLLLFPTVPHNSGDTELLTRQIATHQRIYKRFITLAQKHQQTPNNTLFL